MLTCNLLVLNAHVPL